MANPRKYSKNPLMEWLEQEESPAPTHSRSARTLSAFVKIPKPPAGKKRRPPPLKPAAKPDASMAREAGGPPKPGERHHQQASFEHQLKMSRLPSLRAPYGYKPTSQPQGPTPSRPSARAQARGAAAAKR